jgi:hypothetical protein
MLLIILLKLNLIIIDFFMHVIYVIMFFFHNQSFNQKYIIGVYIYRFMNSPWKNK